MVSWWVPERVVQIAVHANKHVTGGGFCLKLGNLSKMLKFSWLFWGRISADQCENLVLGGLQDRSDEIIDCRERRKSCGRHTLIHVYQAFNSIILGKSPVLVIRDLGEVRGPCCVFYRHGEVGVNVGFLKQ